MDWGLLQFTRDGRVLTRSRLLLPTLTYLLVTVLNLGLRFSWLINRVPGTCCVRLSFFLSCRLCCFVVLFMLFESDINHLPLIFTHVFFLTLIVAFVTTTQLFLHYHTQVWTSCIRV